MIKFKSVEKGQPGVPGGGDTKFYASIVRNEKVDLRTLVEEISESNTLNTADVFAVLESFLQMCTRHLSKGSSIDMGQLGMFSPSIHSLAEETAGEVDQNSIRRFKVNFRPSALLQSRLSTVTYKKVSNGVAEEEPVA
ncbi:MAG: HU family DNA-binding protein [Cyclobacteriaceae bacterium]